MREEDVYLRTTNAAFGRDILMPYAHVRRVHGTRACSTHATAHVRGLRVQLSPNPVMLTFWMIYSETP